MQQKEITNKQEDFIHLFDGTNPINIDKVAARINEELRVSVLTEYPEEECLLCIDNKPFLAKGDIHAIKAKQKHGKTNAVAIFAATLLNGEWGRLKALKKDCRILFIDTEQKASDTQLINKRIFKMSGHKMEDDYDRLTLLTLRQLTHEERKNVLRFEIEQYKPDIVILDGVVDLSSDFNEVGDSQDLISMLMKLSTENNCAIVNVLHTNKASDDHNMRGHLGTILSQKSSNVLECEKDENGIFTVSSADSRHAPVPEWSFMFDENGDIVCADQQKAANIQKHKDEITERKLAREKLTREKWFADVRTAFKRENTDSIVFARLKEVYCDVSGVAKPTAGDHINKLVALGWLTKEQGNVKIIRE